MHFQFLWFPILVYYLYFGIEKVILRQKDEFMPQALIVLVDLISTVEDVYFF